MGTNECSQPASKSSWDSQDFGDVNMVLKMVHFHKSSRPQWVNLYWDYRRERSTLLYFDLGQSDAVFLTWVLFSDPPNLH